MVFQRQKLMYDVAHLATDLQWEATRPIYVHAFFVVHTYKNRTVTVLEKFIIHLKNEQN